MSRHAAFLADNLEADGFKVACATGAAEAVAGDRGAPPVARAARPDAGGGQRAGPARPRARGRWNGHADRPGRAGDRLHRPRRGGRPRARLRARGGRLPGQALRLRRAAGAHRARCCGARNGRPQRGVLSVGDLTVDPATRAVRLAGEPVHLSAKEFALLQALAEEPERVRSKNELLRDVWGYVVHRADAHRRRPRVPAAARSCADGEGSGRAWIVNVRGVGYKLTEAL